MDYMSLYCVENTIWFWVSEESLNVTAHLRKKRKKNPVKYFAWPASRLMAQLWQCRKKPFPYSAITVSLEITKNDISLFDTQDNKPTTMNSSITDHLHSDCLWYLDMQRISILELPHLSTHFL